VLQHPSGCRLRTARFATGSSLGRKLCALCRNRKGQRRWSRATTGARIHLIDCNAYSVIARNLRRGPTLLTNVLGFMFKRTDATSLALFCAPLGATSGLIHGIGCANLGPLAGIELKRNPGTNGLSRITLRPSRGYGRRLLFKRASPNRAGTSEKRSEVIRSSRPRGEYPRSKLMLLPVRSRFWRPSWQTRLKTCRWVFCQTSTALFSAFPGASPGCRDRAPLLHELRPILSVG